MKEAERVEELAQEARYRRERLELYRARTYGGRGGNLAHMRELQRSSDGADARLRAAKARSRAASA